jgi:hypothetical protein
MAITTVSVSNSTVTNNRFFGLVNENSRANLLTRGNNTVEGNGSDTAGAVLSYTAKQPVAKRAESLYPLPSHSYRDLSAQAILAAGRPHAARSPRRSRRTAPEGEVILLQASQ